MLVDFNHLLVLQTTKKTNVIPTNDCLSYFEYCYYWNLASTKCQVDLY